MHGARGRRKVFGYARVSGAEQGKHGTSLEAQQEEIRAYCKRLGLGKPHIFSEVVSGGSEKLDRRVELQRLLSDAQSGDIIIVTRVDRWSRDIVHAVQSVRELVHRGIAWHSIGDNIDASTTNGDSMLGIMAWAADNERKRIRERTVGRRKALRDQGLYVEGLAPVGYRRQRTDGKNKNTLVVVKDRAAWVRLMFERCADGASLAELHNWLDESDSPIKRDRQVLHRMLKNRVYLGEVKTSKGEWIKAHEPIISHELFSRANEALKARRLGGRKPGEKSQTHDWILRGLARCALCDGHMSSAYRTTTSREGGYLYYYACRNRIGRPREKRVECHAPFVRVDHVEPMLDGLVIARLERLHEQLSKPRKTKAAKRPGQSHESRKKKLQTQRAKAIDLAVHGTITREELTARLAGIENQLLELEAAERRVQQRALATTPRARAEVLARVGAIKELWKKATPQTKRELVSDLAHFVALAKGKPPRPKWRTLDELVKEL